MTPIAYQSGSSQSGRPASRVMSSRMTSTGLLHKSDGQLKKYLISCGVLPQSAQTLRLASLFIRHKSLQCPDPNTV